MTMSPATLSYRSRAMVVTSCPLVVPETDEIKYTEHAESSLAFRKALSSRQMSKPRPLGSENSEPRTLASYSSAKTSSTYVSSHNNNNKRIYPSMQNSEKSQNFTDASTKVHVGKTPDSSEEREKVSRHCDMIKKQYQQISRQKPTLPSVPSAGSSKTSTSKKLSVLDEMSDDTCVIEEVRRSSDGRQSIHKYLRGKLLGKGGFAKVYWCTSLDTQKAYAIKIVPKSNLVKPRARQKLQAEIKIHRTLKHQRICEFKHFFEDRTNCYIVLELCQSQTLNELIKRRKRLTEPEVIYYMLQLVEGVDYLHTDNVIHRDLKLGNIFLDSDLRVKIGDFGLACKLADADEKRTTICGTPNYIAPEVIDAKKKGQGHSFEVDIWAMGVIMYATLVGKPPYEAKDVKSTYQRILNNEYSFPDHVDLSDHAKHLITGMLQTCPEDRPSLLHVRRHHFFTRLESKIPLSLPSTCTHVSPTWITDNDGNLIPQTENKSGGLFRKKKVHSSAPQSSDPQPTRRPLSARDLNTLPSQRELLRKPGNKMTDSLPKNGTSRTGNRGNNAKENDAPRNGGLRSSSNSLKFKIFTEDCENIRAKECRDQPEPEPEVQNPVSQASQDKHESHAPQNAVETENAVHELAEKAAACSLKQRTESETEQRLADNEENTKESIKAKASLSEQDAEKTSVRTAHENEQVDYLSTPAKGKQDDALITCAADDPDVNVLESMHVRLSQSFCRAEKRKEAESLPDPSPPPKVITPATKWVTRYVDYTSKYGLGFLLNDGSAGVYFNDSTKVILVPRGEKFHYIERRKAQQAKNHDDANVGYREPIIQEFTLSSYPDSLQKKVTLLKHFRNYLLEQQQKSEDVLPKDDVDKGTADIEKDMVYLKKWVRTRHAILFRLSNRTVQVVFYDHTEVILSSEARLVTYVDKSQNRSTHPIHGVTVDPSCEIAKRLKYAMDILQQLISGNK